MEKPRGGGRACSTPRAYRAHACARSGAKICFLARDRFPYLAYISALTRALIAACPVQPREDGTRGMVPNAGVSGACGILRDQWEGEGRGEPPGEAFETEKSARSTAASGHPAEKDSCLPQYGTS